MQTYLLIFFIWIGCFFQVFGQMESSSDQLNEPFGMDKQQESSYSSSAPIDPNEPFLDDVDNVPEKKPDNFQVKFMNMILVLGLLIGFMILASWMLKRMMRTRVEQLNSASSIKVLETRYLSPKSTIYLLDVMGQGLLIAESHAGISHLATVPLEEEMQPSLPSLKRER